MVIPRFQMILFQSLNLFFFLRVDIICWIGVAGPTGKGKLKPPVNKEELKQFGRINRACQRNGPEVGRK